MPGKHSMSKRLTRQHRMLRGVGAEIVVSDEGIADSEGAL